MHDDFQEFYAASYGKITALVAAVTSDRSEAEDIAQEAFARALGRWQQVSGYEIPEAWVRRVALNLAVDSSRRLRRTLRLLSRLRPSAVQEADFANALTFTALGRALSRMPLREREVLVLHYVADMPVDAIASERGIRVSTVKARLVAGRRRLERELEMDKKGVGDA